MLDVDILLTFQTYPTYWKVSWHFQVVEEKLHAVKGKRLG